MADLTDLAVIKEVLTRHGFTFSKALGQNFLVNPAVCPQMAAACGADESTGVLEIGPGLGVLTKELAQKAKKVVSVELDTRLLPVLSETLQAFDNVTIVNDDILKADLPALFRQQFETACAWWSAPICPITSHRRFCCGYWKADCRSTRLR